MRQNSIIHRLGHENHGLKLKSYELMHQISFLQKQIELMQKTYHTHYTNHANTVAHLQHKNAELNKALIIHDKPPLALQPPAQKSLDFYPWNRHHDHDHRHHCHHGHPEENELYDNGDHLMDEDGSFASPISQHHVPLLPIPQHQYSIVSVHAPMNEMKSMELNDPEHPPDIPPQEPHPDHPPIIPPPGPLPPTPPPTIPSTPMLPYIPQKKRMALIL